MNKHAGVILAVILCIVLLGCVAVFGADLVIFEIPGVGDPDPDKGIVLGLDLQGGSSITYEATKDNPTPDEMDTVNRILRARLDSLGYTEANLYSSAANRVTVEVPGKDASEVAEFLGQTAQLTFRNAAGDILITGDKVLNAQQGQDRDPVSGLPVSVVNLEFDASAQAAFYEATRIASQAAQGTPENTIRIFLDEEQISAPSVREPINSSTCIITMGGEGDQRQEAKKLADLIRAGSLPFSLDVAAKSNISAPLGERALNTSLLAGLIGLILVMVFMSAYYRLPGILASVTLLLYMGIFALLLSVIGVNLTLPGIAGIILTVGMAVDANVIIFERLKDELRSGKTVRSSIEGGFTRAMAAIVDSNITTLIAAGTLYFFGVGPIKGFAVTLFLGICISMFTALVVTKALLNALVGLKVTNLKAFGV